MTAIESRDPTTSGHSRRVATLTVGLAEIVDKDASGPFQDVHFAPGALKEIEYAGLLHDFGKVGVREKVLVKAKKLYEEDRELVLSRFDYIRKALENEALKRKLDLVAKEGDGAPRRVLRRAELDEECARLAGGPRRRILGVHRQGQRADRAGRGRLRAAGRDRAPAVPGADRRAAAVPDRREVAALRLPRGSLTEDERLEIESHVVHTYNFLKKIPWGRSSATIPTIAGAHHEKLDGTGYPRGLKADEIPIESRMMTIADIFDALTATDRPYKKAVPVPKALDIIGFEVKAGKCDADLFRIFVEAEVWQVVIPST